MLPECNEFMELTEIFWLLTKEQQADKEIFDWFSIRKSQIEDEQKEGNNA